LNYLTKLLLIVALLFIIGKKSYSQNLVINPSLEINSGCPIGLGELDRASSWDSPNGGTPDYFHACNSGQFGVPANYMTTLSAFDGNAYTGFFGMLTFNPDYREYVRVELQCQLEAGVSYEVKFRTAIAQETEYAISKIGVAFISANTNYANNTNIPLTPQIEYSDQAYITSENWITVTDTIIASGGELYMMIGSFETNNDPLFVNNISSGIRGAYYLLDAVEVSRIDPVTINCGPDIDVCEGQNLTLSVNGNAAQWQWSIGGTGNTTTTTAETNTAVIVTGTGCSYSVSDTVNITVHTDDYEVTSSTAICAGETIELEASGGTNYQWQGGPTTSAWLVSPTETDTFTVSIQDDYCVDALQVIIEVDDAIPNPIIIGSDLVCVGSEVTYSVIGDYRNVIWDNGSIEDTTAIRIQQPTEIIVETTNTCGTGTASFFVEIEPCGLFVPNTFTPDGSGYNDVFIPVGLIPYEDHYTFFVYNRWGEVVFQTSRPDQGWDGTIEATYAPAPNGLYVYRIQYLNPQSNVEELTGHVNLLR